MRNSFKSARKFLSSEGWLPGALRSFWFSRAGIAVVCALFLVLAYLSFYSRQSPFRIASDPDQLEVINFFAIGDQGSGSRAQRAVARAMEGVAEKQGKLDFVALLGDNFYLDSPLKIDGPEWISRFEQVYTGRYLGGVPFYAIPGNHDRNDGSVDAELEYARKEMGSNRWRMPKTFYFQDYGTVGGRPLLRMVYLDTTADEGSFRQQLAFMASVFKEDPAGPIWKIVAGHHPVRTAGKHHDAQHSTGPLLLSALQKAGVDLYLCGHDHNQQLFVKDDAPLLIVNGAGGAETYAQKVTLPDLRFFRQGHGFVGIRIDGQSLRFKFHDAAGETLTGYRLERSCNQGLNACLKASAS